MNLEVDLERVRLAYKTVRAELLAERSADGRWMGQMSSSPLATAAAVSALVVSHDGHSENALLKSTADESQSASELLIQGELSELVVESLHWLARCQNADGGWGDCDLSRSNLAATLLVQAAFRLTGVPAKYADLIARADDYVNAHGEAAGLWRLEGRELLAAPILANCALAGIVPWRQVHPLPFELACLPPYWQRLLRLPIDAQTLPALLAVGRAKYHHDPPRNPFTRLLRRSLYAKSLTILERLQADDGSFYDSTPLTAFVIMSLTTSGCQKLPIVARGVEFLLASVRPDASWSIYSNQAARNTALALRSLTVEPNASQQPINGENQTTSPDAGWADTARTADLETNVTGNDESSTTIPVMQLATADEAQRLDNAGLDWLLDSQHMRSQSNTLASPGGWGRTDVPGAMPNVGDTATVLYTLARSRFAPGPARRERIERAARLGTRWLLDAQNDDGGWPTFFPSDDFLFLPNESSGADLTAHALRALAAWQCQWRTETPRVVPLQQHAELDEQISAAIAGGIAYLGAQQREDGSFIPMWFGNEAQPDETNPVVGTALVLTACGEMELLNSDMARRAANWLLTAQHAGGGWGPPRVPLDYSGTYRPGTRTWRENDALAQCCTVEETSLAAAALMPLTHLNIIYAQSVSKGLSWLADAVEQDRHHRPAVLGWCFPRLWYHERLQALLLASAALARATSQLTPQRQPAAPVG